MVVHTDMINIKIEIFVAQFSSICSYLLELIKYSYLSSIKRPFCIKIRDSMGKRREPSCMFTNEFGPGGFYSRTAVSIATDFQSGPGGQCKTRILFSSSSKHKKYFWCIETQAYTKANESQCIG